MIKRRPKKNLKRYIPVIISIFLFVILAVLLAYVLTKTDLFVDKIEKRNNPEERTTVVVYDMVSDINLSCPTDQSSMLIQAANKISFDYELITENNPAEQNQVDSIKITINNIPENTKVLIQSSEKNYSWQIDYKNSNNGSFSIKAPYLNQITTLYITVKSQLEECKDEIVRTFSAEVPKLNIYHYFDVCRDLDDFEYCQIFTFAEFDLNEFNKKLKSYVIENKLDKENYRFLFN